MSDYDEWELDLSTAEAEQEFFESLSEEEQEEELASINGRCYNCSGCSWCLGTEW